MQIRSEVKPVTHMRIDMHVHTGRYDGEGTPCEIIERAASTGVLGGVVLLDHDMVPPAQVDLGLPFESLSSYGQSLGIHVDVAVEITVETNVENVHLLWYRFDPARVDEAQQFFSRAVDAKQAAYREMCDWVTGLGMPVDYQGLATQATGEVSRLDIVNQLVKDGWFASPADAKALLEGSECPARVQRLSLREGIQFIQSLGGIAVLAHPFLISSVDRDRLMLEAVEAGLDGFELFYPYEKNGSSASDARAMSEVYATVRGLERLTGRRFAATGGSDYHGAKKPTVNLADAYVDHLTYEACLDWRA